MVDSGAPTPASLEDDGVGKSTECAG